MGFFDGLFLPSTSRAYVEVMDPDEEQQKSLLRNFAEAVGPASDDTKFEIDVVITENLTEENLVTQNPVESGSLVADHVTTMPDKLDIEGLITDTPISLLNPLYDKAEATKGRSKNQYDKLSKLKKKKKRLRITTGLRVYENMVFESLSAKRDNSGHKIGFTASLIEVIVASVSDGSGRTLTSEDTEHSAFSTISRGNVAVV
ncbi:MAG: hypothetical protein HOD85_20680 [Deltaproteobacteria bacterium]|nr:hypothetical protein [Deltaproteobacteria bacterium]MBT4642455.1 hypothetical protein [Deltaproteobacteria bacterium]